MLMHTEEPKVIKLDDAQIEKKCRKFIADSKQHTIVRDQKDRAQRYQDFFRGGTHQWTEEEWNLYKSRGITPITINRCKPVLKALLGMFLQSRQEISVSPRRNGTMVVAQVHKEILKHTQDVSYADYVYCQLFLRGGIDTEAYLKLKIDKGMNINGQPIIEGKSLWDVSVDRNAVEYDLNESAAYVIEREWVEKDEIKALYPGKQEEIKQAIENFDDLIAHDRLAERLATWATNEGEVNGYNEDEGEQIPDSEMLKKYRYLIHHVYWKQIKAAVIVVDKQNQVMNIVSDENAVYKLSRKAKKSERYKITNYSIKILHESVLLGDKLLEDIENPLGEGVSEYPIVRYAPMWDLGYAMGALDDIVDLNKEENIHRTQMIRLLNQTANSGWVVGTDNNKEYIKILKNFGAVPGVVLPKDKFGNYIEKIKPNQPSVGHFQLASQFENDVKRVSGVDDASQGYETGKNESGRALNVKIQNNRSSNEILFFNLYRSLEVFGNMLMKVQLANDFYTDDEIKMIVDESSMIDTKMMALARHRFVTRLGADLPQPAQLPPVDPNVLANIPVEKRFMFIQQVKAGAEGAAQYAQAFPSLNENWEQVIRADAIDMLLQKLREDKGMYGVKVTISPSSPTERMSQFIQMDALLEKYGQLIPPDLFIDLTDLPQAKKEEIKARLAQAAQSQQPQARGAA